MEASDLQPQNLINLLLKYADDTDLVVPASHSHTVQVELDGISRWASDNNLTLNVSKSREMIIRGPSILPDFPSISFQFLARVSALEVLGVSFSDCLDFSKHFKVVCARAARSIYALKVLRAHGLQGANLWQVCRATTISYLTQHLPGGIIPMPAPGCASNLFLTGWGDCVSFPLNFPHTKNYVSTCVGSYSGRCSTTGCTSYTNFFPCDCERDSLWDTTKFP